MYAYLGKKRESDTSFGLTFSIDYEILRFLSSVWNVLVRNFMQDFHARIFKVLRWYGLLFLRWFFLNFFPVSPTIIDEETSADVTAREGDNVTLVCR